MRKRLRKKIQKKNRPVIDVDKVAKKAREVMGCTCGCQQAHWHCVEEADEG